MSDNNTNFYYCTTDALFKSSQSIPAGNLTSEEDGPANLAADKYLFWPNGKTLRVKFLGGADEFKDNVKNYASVWEEYANIDFKFVTDGDADIRVTFNPNDARGTYSYVGTYAQTVVPDQTQPTLNFADFRVGVTRDEEYCRSITHEFGHALGCVHEHQANPIKWDEAKVIAACKARYGWSPETTRSQILKVEDFKDLVRSDFDRNSVMCYWYPSDWTLDGSSAPLNLTLSATDKSFIGKIYPYRTRNVGHLSVDPDIRSWSTLTSLNSKVIAFEPPYLAAPSVMLGITELDEANSSNIRVRVDADPVSREDFTLNMDTWSDTKMYNTAAAWLEFSPSERGTYQNGEFNTLDSRPLGVFPERGADGTQRDTQHVDFDGARYKEPPNVVVWLRAMELAKERNCRIRARAENVTTTGFDLVVESWGDTLLLSAIATWCAYPKGQDRVASGKVSSSDTRRWFPPQAANEGKVNFPSGAFDKVPKVYFALSELDMDSSANLRIKVSADKITAKGFNWHGNSRADSILYAVGADWIAFG